MISELEIARLGVIDRATVALDPGLTVLTGETGAGKTMIMSSILLLLGERAEAQVVRTGADHARVQGRLRLSPRQAELAAATPAELDEGELIVARQVSARGRSRAWLGGAQVSAGTCGELMAAELTVCGQSEQVLLAGTERQRRMLDRAAGAAVAAPLAAYAHAWADRRRIAAEWETLVAADQERVQEMDMLGFGLAEIEKLAPRPGEDATLAVEATRLQDTDDLRAAAHQASAALVGDEDDARSGALALLAVVRREISALVDRDPTAAPLLAVAEEMSIALQDLSGEISAYQARLEADPARLESITARRAALAGLTRKYGRTVDEVLHWSERAAVRLTSLQGADERITALQQESVRLDEELHRLAEVIGRARRAAATGFAARVQAELAALAMPRASLGFEITELDELGPQGAERVELMFTAGPGSPPRPIGKVASGGELSRVRLALEVVLADGGADHTYVFDEVDAGVGGAVGVEIGRRLKRLAERSQVVVVTHLPQVAAFADRHLVVTKADDGQITTSGVTEVSGDVRAQELARMMAGLGTTEHAVAHARELLDEAAGTDRGAHRPRHDRAASAHDAGPGRR